jgi:hypothetical protein
MADNLDQTDPFAIHVDGPAPNGGASSVCYFQDENGQPVRRSMASQAEVVELDSKGNYLFRSYMSLNDRSTITTE